MSTLEHHPISRNGHTVTVRSVVFIGGQPVRATICATEMVTGHPGGFHLMGVPDDAARRDMRERISCAIQASGFSMPRGKLVLEVVPDLPGVCAELLDLPCAIAILVLTRQVDPVVLDKNAIFCGKLATDGTVLPTDLIGAYATTSLHCTDYPLNRTPHTVPLVCAPNPLMLAHLDNLEVSTVRTLREAVDCQQWRPVDGIYPNPDLVLDFGAIHGYPGIKRACQVAVLTNQNMVVVAHDEDLAKTVARCLPSIMDAPSQADYEQHLVMLSAAGISPEKANAKAAPFVAVSSTASQAELIGGGIDLAPGAVSLADKGVLYVPRLTEMSDHLRNLLDDAIATGHVTLSVPAVRRNVDVPARPLVVTQETSCPCEHFGDPIRPCTCSANSVESHQRNVGRATFKSFPIRVDAPSLPASVVLKPTAHALDSKTMREEIDRALAFKASRIALGDEESTLDEILDACHFDYADRLSVANRTNIHDLSDAQMYRVLLMTRALADLEQMMSADLDHLSEAVSYLNRP